MGRFKRPVEVLLPGMTRLSHHSKSKVGRRRSQLALKRKTILVCPSCKGPTFGHRACPQCGHYVKSVKGKV